MGSALREGGGARTGGAARARRVRRIAHTHARGRGSASSTGVRFAGRSVGAAASVGAACGFALFVACAPGAPEDGADGVAGGVAASSSASVAQAAQVVTRSYACEGDYRFSVRIEGDTAWVFLPERAVALSRVATGSGARYGDGEVVFRSKGAGAMLGVGEASYRECVERPQRTPWEAAKRRGVDFRAIGQEPGWFAEIHESERIELVTDYGETRVVTPAPRPEVDASGRTVYRVETEAHRVVIVIEARPCRDVMSGEPFPATVTLELDGRTYRGCGRSLR